MEKLYVGAPLMKYWLKIVVLFSVVSSYSIAPAIDIPRSISKAQSLDLGEIKSLSPKDLIVKWDQRRGVVKFISGHLTKPSGVSKENLAIGFISRYKALLGIQDPGKELEFDRSDITAKGHFIHFKQRKDGLEVIGGKITVRVDKGIITTVANHFEPYIPVSTTPTLSKEEAKAIAKSAVGLLQENPDATLIILPWEEKFYLAYRVDFQFNHDPGPSRYRVYLDAHNRNIILLENRIMYEGPAIGTGAGVDGVLKTIDTYEKGGTFYLGNLPIPGVDKVTVKTHTANGTTRLPGTILSDTDNYWEDSAGVDAHFYTNVVVDFYRNNFSDFSWFERSGFKVLGGLLSTVHYKDAYDNAFWEGRQMVYGDGDDLFYPLSGSLDIVAHEVTHGVTDAINNLIYCNEPGALNESWSDVMAMLVSIDYGALHPYWIAEDVMKIADTRGNEAYYALRRMDDPSFRTDAYRENDYNPSEPLRSWGQPEHTSEQYRAGCFPWTDNGGVHINSGIPSRAAYFITINVGAAKAKQIYYHAMFYLSSNSNFADARAAVEQATIDLYGNGSELSSVQVAFEAVGIR